MEKIRKDPSTAFGWLFWPGVIGAHHFYLGNTHKGIIWFVFSWTTIPAIVGLFQMFTIKEKVRQFNNQNAEQLAELVKMFPA